MQDRWAGRVQKCHDCLNVFIQVHYSAFQVNFLDFEEEEDQTSQDEGVASIEDDDGIEG